MIPIWTSECSLFLILKSNDNLIVITIIQETIMRKTFKSIKHLINKRKRKVIFPSSFIQITVINTNTASCHNPGGYKLIFFILNHNHSTFLGHYLYKAFTYRLSKIAYISHAFKSLRTSFFTTFFMVGLNLLWCSTEEVKVFSTDGLIFLRSSISQPITDLYAHKTLDNFSSST